MATLRRRNERNGNYVLDYYDVDGHRYRIDTGTTDRWVADLWLAKVIERISLARIGQIHRVGAITIHEVRGAPRPVATRLTLSRFKDEYADRCLHDLELAESTIALSGNALDSLISMVGDITLDKINQEIIRAWKRKIIRDGKSRTTVSIYQRNLRTSLGRAVGWGLMDDNPLVGLELPKTKSTRQAMSQEDVATLLSSIHDTWFRDFVQFLLLTGCRRNEILYLKNTDIDTDHWILRVEATKTGRHLMLPINKALREVIGNMNLNRTHIFESRMIPGQPWGPDGVTHKFKTEIRKAGLSEAYSLHSLRHTYATHLQEKGVPRDIVQKLLGHSSPVTTGIYDHSEALHFREYADKADFG
jgi:integrase/recombinase XerD